MKTTVEIPDEEVAELMERTHASTEKDAILTAIRVFNRRERMSELALKLHGSMPDFMSQTELMQLREDHKAEKTT